VGGIAGGPEVGEAFGGAGGMKTLGGCCINSEFITQRP
jgi:hypothetical protein